MPIYDENDKRPVLMRHEQSWADDDWLYAARLLKKGDAKSLAKLKEMDNTPLVKLEDMKE